MRRKGQERAGVLFLPPWTLQVICQASLESFLQQDDLVNLARVCECRHCLWKCELEAVNHLKEDDISASRHLSLVQQTIITD